MMWAYMPWSCAYARRTILNESMWKPRRCWKGQYVLQGGRCRFVLLVIAPLCLVNYGILTGGAGESPVFLIRKPNVPEETLAVPVTPVSLDPLPLGNLQVKLDMPWVENHSGPTYELPLSWRLRWSWPLLGGDHHAGRPWFWDALRQLDASCNQLISNLLIPEYFLIPITVLFGWSFDLIYLVAKCEYISLLCICCVYIYIYIHTCLMYMKCKI